MRRFADRPLLTLLLLFREAGDTALARGAGTALTRRADPALPTSAEMDRYLKLVTTGTPISQMRISRP